MPHKRKAWRYCTDSHSFKDIQLKERERERERERELVIKDIDCDNYYHVNLQQPEVKGERFCPSFDPIGKGPLVGISGQSRAMDCTAWK